MFLDCVDRENKKAKIQRKGIHHRGVGGGTVKKNPRVHAFDRQIILDRGESNIDWKIPWCPQLVTFVHIRSSRAGSLSCCRLQQKRHKLNTFFWGVENDPIGDRLMTEHGQ